MAWILVLFQSDAGVDTQSTAYKIGYVAGAVLAASVAAALPLLIVLIFVVLLGKPTPRSKEYSRSPLPEHEAAAQEEIRSAERKAGVSLIWTVVGVCTTFLCVGLVPLTIGLVLARSANATLLNYGRPPDGQARAATIVGWLGSGLQAVGAVGVVTAGTLSDMPR